jgi:hypothetical protein
MKFSIDYNGKTEQRVLNYDTDGYAFDMEPRELLINVEIALNYLCLTTIRGDNSVVEIDGFCPYGEWIKTNHNVPQSRQGKLKLIDDLESGHGAYGINDVHWPVYVNPDTGWICVGNPENQGEAVEFINGCVAVIGTDSDILSLWLKPKELPYLAFDFIPNRSL